MIVNEEYEEIAGVWMEKGSRMTLVYKDEDCGIFITEEDDYDLWYTSIEDFNSCFKYIGKSDLDGHQIVLDLYENVKRLGQIESNWPMSPDLMIYDLLNANDKVVDLGSIVDDFIEKKDPRHVVLIYEVVVEIESIHYDTRL